MTNDEAPMTNEPILLTPFCRRDNEALEALEPCKGPIDFEVAASGWVAEGCGWREDLLRRARLEQLEGLEANHGYGRVSGQLSVVSGAGARSQVPGASRTIATDERGLARIGERVLHAAKSSTRPGFQ
jgi:hypothetical protein